MTEEEKAIAYEEERLANIAANNALLAQLGLVGGSSAALGVEKKRSAAGPASTKPAAKRRKAEPIQRDANPRRSARQRGLEADSETLKKQAEAQQEIARQERRKLLRARHSPYKLDSLPEPVPDLGILSATLMSTSESKDTVGDIDDERARPSKELVELQDEFKGLGIKAECRLFSERIYCMEFHPIKDKTILFAGSKVGELGIWDAFAPSIVEAAEDEPADERFTGEGRHWSIQAHGRNSLSWLKVDPSDPRKLYTSSYDCSVRCLDIETQASREVFSIRNEDFLINQIDIPLEGNELWAVDKNGGLSHVDLREGGSVRRRWVVGEGKKLGGVSINPQNSWLLCTAGNDTAMRLWDVRQLHNVPKSSSNLEVLEEPEDEKDQTIVETWPEINTGNEVVRDYGASPNGQALARGVYKHKLSCSSAFWDPTGSKILTTSYDNHLRCWNFADGSAFQSHAPFTAKQFGDPLTVIDHDCQTGRWLTIFRAKWSRNSDFYPHFTVGNMKRSLDVYAWTGEPVARLFDGDTITAVPAVTASHPGIVNNVAGGMASGKVYLWSKQETA